MKMGNSSGKLSTTEDGETAFEQSMFCPCRMKQKQIFWIRVIYAIAMIFWIFIIWYLQMKITDIWDVLIILIPFVVFMISMACIGNGLSPHSEGIMVRNNYVNSALIIIFSLMIWACSKIEGARQSHFLLMIIVATIFGLLSYYDLWVGEENYTIVKHLRTVFCTFSITILIFALKYFYIDRIRCPGENSMMRDVADRSNDDFLIAGASR